MTLAELKNILDSTGYPVAYSHFNNDIPNPPFITYLVDGSSNFFADNKTFSKVDDVTIELYTNIKDLQAEKKIESLLDQYDLPYETTEIWIDSEKLFQKVYEIGVI